MRGGIKEIKRGKYEGEDEMGIRYWKKKGMVVMKKELKMVIKGIVKKLIGILKDKRIVYIIGMLDIMGIVRKKF